MIFEGKWISTSQQNFCHNLGRAFPVFDLIREGNRTEGKIYEPGKQKQNPCQENEPGELDRPGSYRINLQELVQIFERHIAIFVTLFFVCSLNGFIASDISILFRSGHVIL
jgi:hypothetical protein